MGAIQYVSMSAGWFTHQGWKHMWKNPTSGLGTRKVK